jgi:hypothetical protein
MSDDVVETLNVYCVDPMTQEESRIGIVEYTSDGRLTVIDVDPAFDGKLRDAVAALNGKTEIVELIPSDAPDATKHAVATKVTRRGDEEFFGALSGYLERYYGLTLG